MPTAAAPIAAAVRPLSAAAVAAGTAALLVPISIAELRLGRLVLL